MLHFFDLDVDSESRRNLMKAKRQLDAIDFFIVIEEHLNVLSLRIKIKFISGIMTGITS